MVVWPASTTPRNASVVCSSRLPAPLAGGCGLSYLDLEQLKLPEEFRGSLTGATDASPHRCRKISWSCGWGGTLSLKRLTFTGRQPRPAQVQRLRPLVQQSLTWLIVAILHAAERSEGIAGDLRDLSQSHTRLLTGLPKSLSNGFRKHMLTTSETESTVSVDMYDGRSDLESPNVNSVGNGVQLTVFEVRVGLCGGRWIAGSLVWGGCVD
jgi:hypothetical protein